MTLTDLITAARRGTHDVARWHCHPQECLRNSGDGIIRHQREVATLALSLCAWIGHSVYDSDLIDYCQRHDEPERLFGDWPASVAAIPFLREAKEQADDLFWRGHPNPLPDLDETETAIFTICDKLEAYLFARSVGADMYADGFPDDLVKLQRWVLRIGPDDEEAGNRRANAVAWLGEKLG